jgi:hypothetical protein
MTDWLSDLWSPIPGASVFDWNTLVYLATWIVVGAFVKAIHGRRDRAFIICLVGFIMWKVGSGFAAMYMPNVEHSEEIPMNALMDICTCPVGLLLVWLLADGKLKKE